jgi:hypothetical protein
MLKGQSHDQLCSCKILWGYAVRRSSLPQHFENLPLPSLIKCTSLQFMHQYVNGFLPQAFQDEWPTNADLRGENLPILRTQDDLFIPFARSCFADRMPYFSLPKLWSSFNVAEIKFITDKNSFKINFKKHLLGELSSIPICNRL